MTYFWQNPIEFGKNPRTYTPTEAQAVAKNFSKSFSMPELRRKQHLNLLQQEQAFAQQNIRALENLQMMELVIAKAIDMKTWRS